MSLQKSLKRKNTIKLFITLIIIVIINVFSANIFKRIDMTAEKRYSVSDYTKQTLKNLNGQIFITIYLEGNDLPLQFKKFRKAIIEQLDIFKVYAGQNIDFEFVNPTDESLSDDEMNTLMQDLYNLGIVRVEDTKITDGQATKTLIYPSAVVTYNYYDVATDSMFSHRVGLNLLNNDPNYEQASPENINNSLQTLEYKFINEIKKITQTSAPTIVFLEGHGELDEPNVIDIERSLFEYYHVLRGELKGRYGILDSIEVLVIAKPTQEFSDSDKFVIDQYIMNGGKVLWLVDGVNVSMDSIYNYEYSYAMPANTEVLRIDDQLFTYGVRINTDILKDLLSSTIMLKGVSSTGQERDYWYNWTYFPLLITENNNVINKYIDAIKTEFISSIDTVGNNSDIKKTMLLSTSFTTRQIGVNFPLEINFEEINEIPNEQMFQEGGKPVAVLLEGQFPSLWKGRIVDRYMQNPALFKEKSVPTKMIVVSDGDIIANVVKSNGETMPLGFDKYSFYSYDGNKQFIMNAINYLADDEGLMSIRSREFKLRLLDQTTITSERTKWQLINLLSPIIFILLLGLFFNLIRNRKYKKINK